jgi:hypothetical protein
MSAFWAILSNWWSGVGLRVKIIASVAASVLSVMGYLLARWRIASIKASRASDRAERLEAARGAEITILQRQEAVRQRQEKLRQQLRQRRERDYFEGGY